MIAPQRGMCLEDAVCKGESTAYDYRDEGIAVLAIRRPGLHEALPGAKTAGHTRVILDGTLIYTDRIHPPGPTAGVCLWWLGKRKYHGGNIQVVSTPDGWAAVDLQRPPGSGDNTMAARADPVLLQRISQ